MTASDKKNRVKKGVPTGGQFSEKRTPEADVKLAAAASDVADLKLRVDDARTRMIQRRVNGGYNKDESRQVLANVEATFSDPNSTYGKPGSEVNRQNFAHALTHNGFATETQASLHANRLHLLKNLEAEADHSKKWGDVAARHVREENRTTWDKGVYRGPWGTVHDAKMAQAEWKAEGCDDDSPATQLADAYFRRNPPQPVRLRLRDARDDSINGDIACRELAKNPTDKDAARRAVKHYEAAYHKAKSLLEDPPTQDRPVRPTNKPADDVMRGMEGAIESVRDDYDKALAYRGSEVPEVRGF